MMLELVGMKNKPSQMVFLLQTSKSLYGLGYIYMKFFSNSPYVSHVDWVR